jgi:putative transposase
MIPLLIAEGGRSLASGFAVRGRVAMMKPKLSPREIVERLQTIEALTAEGVPVAEALRSVGMREVEYERWRVEYNGLGRTLGPLLRAPPKPRRTRRAGSAHRPKEPLCS